jgi:hypothetical protein
MIFDRSVYQASWIEIINNEIFRQRDKAASNDIGYFHQRIFSYIDNCEIPSEGWDVILRNDKGISLPTGDTVRTVYAEMKNKHNTMNSASAGKTYIKMQDQLLQDDDCACFLVEAIAKQSQNVTWKTTVDKQKVSHKKIRRVSLDKFYELTTGDPEAFYKLCLVLPEIINRVIKEIPDVQVPTDTAGIELEKVANEHKGSFEMSLYLLGFETYNGFAKLRTPSAS